MVQFPFLVDSFSDILYINNILFCTKITAYSFYLDSQNFPIFETILFNHLGSPRRGLIIFPEFLGLQFLFLVTGTSIYL